MPFDGLTHLTHEFIVPDTRPSLLQQFNARRNSFHDLECLNTSKSTKSMKSMIEDLKSQSSLEKIEPTVVSIEQTETTESSRTTAQETDSVLSRKISICSDSYKEPVLVTTNANRYKDLFEGREFRTSTITDMKSSCNTSTNIKEVKSRCNTASTCESQLSEAIVESTVSNKNLFEKKIFHFNIFSSMKSLMRNASSKCSNQFMSSSKNDDIEFFELFPTSKSEMSGRESFSMKWDKNSIKSVSMKTDKEQIQMFNSSKNSVETIIKNEANSTKIAMTQNSLSRKNPMSTKSTKQTKPFMLQSENEKFRRSSLNNCTG